MTSPDPADLSRAPRHAQPPDDDTHALTRTKLDGMRECGGSHQPMSERGMSVDRLALALLLIAVFVAVPLGLLALQAA
jgi:hypothetical protein